MTVGILDYGMGNLRSVQKAVERVGGTGVLLDSAAGWEQVDRLILPGVGAFGDGMQHLAERGLIEPIRAWAAAGRPLLGICLGMQLLFSSSEENASTEAPVPGLDLVAGRVVRFSEDQGPDHRRLKVPHMGWNAIAPQGAALHGLLQGIGPQDCVYFVHSFYCQPHEETVVAARTDYGRSFCAAIEQGALWATQFHPEKSQAVGLRILENFVRQVA